MTATIDPASPFSSPPGTLHIPTGSPPPRIRLMEFDSDSLEEIDDVSTDALRPYANT
jgi:hypothetical protein